MLKLVHFLQECPVCGRPNRVRRKYVGLRVVCQHCGGAYVAAEPRRGQVGSSEGGPRLLRQANRLLETLNRRPACWQG